MFYIMRLVDLKKTGEFHSVYKQLPKLNSLVRFVACFKFKGYSASLKEMICLALVFTLLCVAISLTQTILSLFFWEWFGLSRMTAMYLISLGVMLSIFTFLTLVSSYVRGMSVKIDSALNKSKYLAVIGFIFIFIVFTFFKADDYALIMTIELMMVIVSLISIFVERDFNCSKIHSDQFKELIEVRTFNLQLMKLKSRTSKKDIELNTQIDELYKKSSKIEIELTQYFSD